jgi:hypothetical protein
MKTANTMTIFGLAAAVAIAALAPMSAMADQNSKNQWRNLGIGGAAVAGYGLLHHNSTATLLGVAGAAYSANRYEQDRHHQSQAQAARNKRAYYYRHHTRTRTVHHTYRHHTR